MKRNLTLLLSLGMILCLTVHAGGQTLKYYGGFDIGNQGYQEFVSQHPDLRLKGSETYYNNTGEFIGALLTQSLDSDVFLLNNHMHDYQQIMKKGYLLDLSGSKVISEAISRMHPSIVKQTKEDGRIYAVPERIGFDYMQINRDGWERAGLTEGDVPGSFPDFLDFLEKWCDRSEKSGEQNIRINLMWDWDLYNEGTYTGWLSGILIDSYILQKQYAEEQLSFNEPELAVLLERCKAIGRRLFDVEPQIKGENQQGIYYTLFENGLQSAWPQSMAWVPNFRLNDAQPKLMKAWMHMYSINVRTEISDLCVELLEKIVTGPESPNGWMSGFLYQDSEPIPNPNYEESLKHWTDQVNDAKEKLSNPNLSLDQKQEIEESLNRYEYYLEQHNDDTKKFYISPSQLEEYKQYANGLFFPSPGVFDSSSESFKILDNLQKQFGAGVLSTEQFMGELSRIARMVELENQ